MEKGYSREGIKPVEIKNISTECLANDIASAKLGINQVRLRIVIQKEKNLFYSVQNKNSFYSCYICKIKPNSANDN
jgi:hypothetical protein